ncbi:hypothetical protein G7074_18040 [Pedobacter sp. HDW13]|uniref:hypothetical protein n=1 Tax=Pedobacter sp. HDW13 TaxID=2714940 RepID=UPI0014085F8B|nr:hypothetical protein [Pedobacter sp. HDW13]QIL41000.1 hypothetical protein G7074_18040 [Pedobacter sp. HDW13]
MLKRISSIKDRVEELREKGVQKGDDTGFKCLDELYSVKQGTFTIFQGAPTHGKSEVIFEVLMNQATKYGKKSLVLSPESGNAEEITLELIHKYLKKSPYKSNPYSTCTEKEFNSAFNWVDYHFVIADDDEKSYSFDELIAEVDEYEAEYKTVFELLMAEPWNELNHKLALQENSGRQDLAIEDELTMLRQYNKKKDKHTFLSFHPSNQQLIYDKDSGTSFYAMPKAREAAGGQATLRKAFSWINIWRPPVGLIDPEFDRPYLENELIVQVEKSKPKGVGKKGICRLFFDWKGNRYYEEINGNISYAFEHEEKVQTVRPITAIQPNIEFDKPFTKEIIIRPTPLDEYDDDPPF